MAALVTVAYTDADVVGDDPVEPPMRPREDEAKQSRFLLRRIHRGLAKELKAFATYRTDAFVPDRPGIRVEKSTVTLDRGRLLRFLGYLVYHARGFREATITLAAVFDPAGFKASLMGFVRFLMEQRQVKSSTIAGYVHSLGIVAQFQLGTESPGAQRVQRWITNVEKQAQRYRDIENVLNPSTEDFVSWYELQIARVQAVASYDAMREGEPGSELRRAKALAAQRLVAMLLLTTGPVARITVLRLLQYGKTLKWREAAQRFVIDLTDLQYRSSYHKTLKRYGRYVLPLARLDGDVARILREFRVLRHAFLDPSKRDAGFVFVRTGRKVRKKNEPMEASAFSGFVKDAFRPWTPENKTPTPRMFRKIFETFIRTLPYSDTAPLLVDSPEATRVYAFQQQLQEVSAEYLFHSVTTANKSYDLKTYNFAKLSKLVDWMDVFSAQFSLGPGGFVVISPLVRGWKALNEVTRDETRVEARAWEVMEQRGQEPAAVDEAKQDAEDTKEPEPEDMADPRA